uniref:Reverse transcriptase/retrotransposon-derived protein RNase H-like domain-containing protein n=1 Tax=Nicotiana tabacum TaxID=4097 RepID=A0A1S3ZA67_TOBAC
MIIFENTVRFLGHNIEKGRIIPINRSIEFASKFPDIITDKTQLQRFIGSLNYISHFIKDLAKDTALLYDRLKKNPKAWTHSHTELVKRIKQKVQDKVHNLSCLTLANPTWAKVVKTYASDIGYGGILKQCYPLDTQEYLVQFYSGKWNESQKNYATVAKEILIIVKC